jgi:signal transduction histidine kinase
MLFLVNDILDFAQIEQKNIVLNVHQEVNIT